MRRNRSCRAAAGMNSLGITSREITSVGGRSGLLPHFRLTDGGLRVTKFPSYPRCDFSRTQAPLGHAISGSSEAVNLLDDRVFDCRKSLFLVDRSTVE